MDSTWTVVAVAAATGLGSGLLGTLFGPWVQYAVKRRLLRRERREELLRDAESLVTEARRLKPRPLGPTFVTHKGIGAHAREMEEQ